MIKKRTEPGAATVSSSLIARLCVSGPNDEDCWFTVIVNSAGELDVGLGGGIAGFEDVAWRAA